MHSLVTALSNDFTTLSFALLKDEGTFTEIGKNNIWSFTRACAVRPTVDYVAVQADDGCRECPGWNRDPWWFNSQLRKLRAGAEAEEITPLPLQGFDR